MEDWVDRMGHEVKYFVGKARPHSLLEWFRTCFRARVHEMRSSNASQLAVFLPDSLQPCGIPSQARTKSPNEGASSVSFESREACAEKAGIKHFFTMAPSVPCLYNWQCHGILRASRLVRKIGSLGVVMGHGPGKASVGRCLLVGQHTCSCKLRGLTLFLTRVRHDAPKMRNLHFAPASSS